MHISVKLLPHVTVLVLIISKSRITLIVAIIVMTFFARSFRCFVRVVGIDRVVHMVKVIDFPVVAIVDMANVMMINQNVSSLLISVVVLVVVDVFLLMMANKTLCCLCCVLVK